MGKVVFSRVLLLECFEGVEGFFADISRISMPKRKVFVKGALHMFCKAPFIP